MGTIVKRGARIRAVVRKNGQTLTKTFDKVGEAKAWIAETEVTVIHRVVYAGGMDLGAICKKYREEVLLPRPGHSTANAIHYKRHAIQFDKVELRSMSRDWWVDAVRGFKVAPASATRYVREIKSALTAAQDLWKAVIDWKEFEEGMAALTRQRLISEGRARTRRVSDSEINALKAARAASPGLLSTDAPLPMVDIIDFAVLTSLRLGEITALKWADLDDNKKRPMIWARDRKDPKNKIGNDDQIPLLGNALAIIQRQSRAPGEKRIFPFLSPSVGRAFQRMRDAAGLEDLHFHDLRHEAISRLFEQGYSVQEVALLSGHKNWKMLKRYTHLNPASLHDGPLSRRAA